MKTITFELNFRVMFFALAFGLVGCNKEEFYEKEFLENPFAPEIEVPETVGGTTGGSTVGGSTVGGTTGGTTTGSTAGGSSAGGTVGGGQPVSDWTDNFTQVADSDKKLDIIWVIDNSGSMDPFQTSLANNFSSFINTFIDRGINFQMGITTTDCSNTNRCGVAVTNSLNDLTSARAAQSRTQFITNFRNMIRVGTNGSGNERGLQGAENFLNRYGQSWMRENSRLVVVYVSDEEDQSPESVNYYLNRLLAAKAASGADFVRAYSILRLNGCNSGGGVVCGIERYSHMSNNTNGSIANLSSNFATTLSSMGADIQNLIDSFSLSHTPISGSLEVKVNGVVGTEWTLDGRNLKFNQGHVPAVGANIQVNYQY